MGESLSTASQGNRVVVHIERGYGAPARKIYLSVGNRIFPFHTITVGTNR